MILVSDFDDTLYLHDNEEAFQKNLAAVQEFRQAGNIFCLATGRSESSLKRRWPDYRKNLDYFILDNGSMCLNQQGQVMFEYSIPLTTAEAICQEIISKFASVAQAAFVYYHDMSEWKTLDTDVTKLRCWVNNDSVANEIVAMFGQDYSEQVKSYAMFNVLPSSVSWLDQTVAYTAFVDIMPREAGKDQAITRLSQILNIQKIVTVGDGANDLAMIQKFNGYAMQNSASTLLEMVGSDHIIPSVSDLIQKLLD